jgi:ribA/ribD-fused uncharacterized protein
MIAPGANNLTYLPILLTNMSLSTLPELSHTVSLLATQVSELTARLDAALATIAGGAVAAPAKKQRKSKKSAEPESNSSSPNSSSSAAPAPAPKKKGKEPKEKPSFPAATEGAIRFSGSTGASPYIVFSPLYKAEFTVDGKTYGTVENYVQASKYATTNPELAEQLRTNDKPATLRMTGNAKKYASIVAPGYDASATYRAAYQAQIETHEAIQKVLTSTGEADLEAEYPDAVLGINYDGNGANIIGRILMAIRTEL